MRKLRWQLTDDPVQVLDNGSGRGVPVHVEWTPCRFGGQRPWFICPGCGERVGVLYDIGLTSGGWPEFICRRCGNLAYQMENETRTGRKILRAKRLRVRAGGTGNLFEAFPEKPLEMSERTYERLRARGEQADQVAFEAIEAELRANEAGLRADKAELERLKKRAGLRGDRA